MRRELRCLAPSDKPRFEVRNQPIVPPKGQQVLVRIEATSVNPIDAKRAAGYGQRLLALKGAGSFPLTLGNDLCGRVEAVGSDIVNFRPGQRVFGLLPTGRSGGAHASHALLPESLLRLAPEGIESSELAVLPYSFTTLWLAVQATRLQRENARGKRVLVHGAAGALGRLGLQLLSNWGCHIAAVCDRGRAEDCRALGAHDVVERGVNVIRTLPNDFDVVLNFANWDDELALASRLAPDALGHATTVHPLLGHFDRLGWIRGAMASRRDKALVNAAVRARAPNGQYHWTIFKPDPGALDELAAGLTERRYGLPVGLTVPFEQAHAAFQHVCAGQFGRAVLRP